MLDLLHPDLGYFFYPSDTFNHPGHPRLDIIILPTPSYLHFDPHTVHYNIASPQGGVERICVTHPWLMGRHYRACAGRIIIKDRNGKLVEAFSFGGELHIESTEEYTACCLTSPAPIIPLFTTHDLCMWITAEAEILLAQQKAHWDPQHPHEFEAHLAAIDPYLLYISCLHAINEKGHHIHSGSESLDHQGHHFVSKEINRLIKNGNWPASIPAIDQLF